MTRAGLQRVGVMLLALPTAFACAAPGPLSRSAPSASVGSAADASAPKQPSETTAAALNSEPKHRNMAISNQTVARHRFLAGMYADDYFPKPLVDKGAAILLRLCETIERERPTNTAALYALTHAATREFNRLDEEFAANSSEIETAAREVIAADFEWIAKAYGFDADVEELIAPREW